MFYILQGADFRYKQNSMINCSSKLKTVKILQFLANMAQKRLFLGWVGWQKMKVVACNTSIPMSYRVLNSNLNELKWFGWNSTIQIWKILYFMPIMAQTGHFTKCSDNCLQQGSCKTPFYIFYGFWFQLKKI